MSVMMPEKTEDGLEEIWDKDIICTMQIDGVPCTCVAVWWHVGRCPAEGLIFRSPVCDQCKGLWMFYENLGITTRCNHCRTLIYKVDWEKM